MHGLAIKSGSFYRFRLVEEGADPLVEALTAGSDHYCDRRAAALDRADPGRGEAYNTAQAFGDSDERLLATRTAVYDSRVNDAALFP